ncbi:hypothetical protein JRO89_XS09G0141800 [Xanthoceras sorbifolium]|uniref:2-oxoglutarate-dependent dioxygenase n=1 Tax=Xanthoceras sorbifolium TaxID=99658 RepID=A0ABQ8HLA4_9ROSI|nr:hypothetical protein JRO89_XS09G0141800 [Xanthoceras sorbifolium]
MGSLPIPNLPVIDLSKENLKPGTSSWLSTCRNVTQALEEYGCFVAMYDGVALELHDAMFSAVEKLFDLPLEIKKKNTSEKPYFGYVGRHQPFIPALYEGMGIDFANTLEGAQNFSSIMWPHGNDSFSKTVVSYSKQVSELEKTVKKMVFESYGVEKYYESLNESSTYLLRMMKYRGPEKNETNVGCESHTDKSFLTILHQNEVNGLEIKTKDGHWIGFDDPTPSSFVVLAADAFLVVVMNGSNARYSLGLFTYNEGIIHIPEELADDEHPLQFKPFEHFGLLRYYVTEEGSQAHCTAKAYCGVSNPIQSNKINV